MSEVKEERGRDVAPGYWAVIPANVRYDAELSPNAKLLYAEISSLCNETGYCWATNLYFEKLFSVSSRTVSRMISQLESKGYIATEMIPVGDGSERHIYGGIDKNVYTPIDNFVMGGIDKNVSPINMYNNKHRTNTPIAPKGGECTKVYDFEPELFERFWDFYPNWGGSGKGNKQRAKKAWNKLKPDASLRHTIAAALKKQMATKAWQDGIGIPHASTYLNGHRWEDAEELQTERPRAVGEYESAPVYGHQIGGAE